MKIIKSLLILFFFQLNAQQGGMWIPSLLKGLNEKEMKSLGMKMSINEIYDVNKSSLKDAIPHFNGGCTSEIISPKGLLLTNYHCGDDAIQNHSSLEHDYLTNGFWAYKMEDELPNENLEVTFIIRIEDVTTKVLEGTEKMDSEIEKQNKIEKNISLLNKTLPKQNWQENNIKSFFEGNQYMLFVTETFKDIRLVGAPPSAIGKFGSDTDNWVWPRHTGDFSLFRIYADKNNRPAPYSKDNLPYKPKNFLKISLDGIEEDDFTLVFGYPGKTNEYLPAVAIAQIANELNPAKIEIRDQALKITDEFMRKDKKIKIQYASKYANIANYWKKWIGETQGLKKSNAVATKKKQEKIFQEKITTAKKQEEYGKILFELEKNYNAIGPYALSRDYFKEVVLINIELLSVGFKLYELSQIYETKGESSFIKRRNNLIEGLPAFYKNFNPVVDQKIFEQLIPLYTTKVPSQFSPSHLLKLNAAEWSKRIYEQSKLISYESIKETLAGDPKTVISKLNEDQGYLFIKSLSDQFLKEVNPTYEELNSKINGLQRTYMKAQFELNQDSRIFPDANSTMRVTYGKVKAYTPKDAVWYDYMTYLDGVIEKYIPDDYEFDVPKKLLDLYETKNYGPYAENGKLPVCFIATNHTTGGNSGSPALDSRGNLIGLNFDRVWEGTMSDLYYDPKICRNIMVDVRYILFVIDKFARADNIMKELTLIHPKKKKRKIKKNM